jgi:hypothetical protein
MNCAFVFLLQFLGKGAKASLPMRTPPPPDNLTADRDNRGQVAPRAGRVRRESPSGAGVIAPRGGADRWLEAISDNPHKWTTCPVDRQRGSTRHEVRDIAADFEPFSSLAHFVSDGPI